MAMCCIGGVCIPYSALLPLLVLGLKWLVGKLVEFGLLPKSIEQQISSVLAPVGPGQKPQNKENDESATGNKERRQKRGKGCCCNEGDKKESSVSDLTATTTSSSSSGGDEDSGAVPVREIQSEEEWDEIASPGRVVVAKFTAPWCKPCKAIHPCYVSLAERYATPSGKSNNGDSDSVVFVTVDSDDLDEISARCSVVMLPTFCVVRCSDDGAPAKVVDRYAGSSSSKLRELVERNLQ